MFLSFFYDLTAAFRESVYFIIKERFRYDEILTKVIDILDLLKKLTKQRMLHEVKQAMMTDTESRPSVEEHLIPVPYSFPMPHL